jgi:hypothetical protein
LGTKKEEEICKNEFKILKARFINIIIRKLAYRTPENRPQTPRAPQITV